MHRYRWTTHRHLALAALAAALLTSCGSSSPQPGSTATTATSPTTEVGGPAAADLEGALLSEAEADGATASTGDWRVQLDVCPEGDPSNLGRLLDRSLAHASRRLDAPDQAEDVALYGIGQAAVAFPDQATAAAFVADSTAALDACPPGAIQMTEDLTVPEGEAFGDELVAWSRSPYQFDEVIVAAQIVLVRQGRVVLSLVQHAAPDDLRALELARTVADRLPA